MPRLSPGVNHGDPGGDVYGDQGLGDGLAPTPHIDGDLSRRVCNTRGAVTRGVTGVSRHRFSRPAPAGGELQGTRRPVK